MVHILGLITVVTTGTFPGEYVPTCGFGDNSVNMMHNNLPYNIGLWDTQGADV